MQDWQGWQLTQLEFVLGLRPRRTHETGATLPIQQLVALQEQGRVPPLMLGCQLQRSLATFAVHNPRITATRQKQSQKPDAPPNCRHVDWRKPFVASEM